MASRQPITASLCAVLLFSACSTGANLDIPIDESSQGGVYLKPISDRSFQAAHPIKIDSSTIALVLNGILIRDNLSVSGAAETHRTFTGSEISYLAPLISEGLRRAASDQQVGFKVGQAAGILYAYGRSLYVTLTDYRLRDESTSAADRSTPHQTGLVNHTVFFIPEDAKRPSNYLDARSTENTVVIDWQLLARLPPTSGIPSTQSAPARPQPSDVGAAEPARKDAEIEALRKELQEIKKQLAEQQAERARSQSQPSVPQL